MTDQSLHEKTFRNILIIKPSAAGDIVTALPVLPALREKYGKNVRISWMVASHLKSLLAGHPLIDDLVEFDRKRYGKLLWNPRVFGEVMNFLWQLNRAKYDLVIDLQGLIRTAFFSWTTAAGVRVGPAEKREFGWLFYTDRCPERPKDTHIVDRIATVSEVLGLDMREPKFVLPIRDADRRAVSDMLAPSLADQPMYVAMAPGGTWSSKRWPIDRMVQLAKRVRSELHRPVVILGGRDEQQMGRFMVESLGDRHVIDLTGRTTMPQLLAAIDGAAALVTNDSGPMHMAVALGRPVTAIIGPTNPHRTGPWRQLASVVQTTLECAACNKRRCPNAGPNGEPRCMANISVESVFENLRQHVTPA